MLRSVEPSSSVLLIKERLYEPNDLPCIAELYTTSIRSLAAPFYSPEQIVAWKNGTAVSARQFLADVAQLAACLPAGTAR
jgi:hypothetical protein